VKALFGQYAPDLPAHLSENVTAISNLYPGANGYRPVGAFTSLYTALPTVCRGAATFTSSAGRSLIVAGTATNLYVAQSGGFTSIGSGYSLQANNRWRFQQFGGLAIATNGVDPLQKIDTTNDTVSALGGTPPRLEALAAVQAFLVGTVADGDVNSVAWSGQYDPEWWEFGQRQSNYEIFADGGRVNGIVGGEFALILQRNCVRRMSYVGGSAIWRFDKIATNVGCVTPHSVAQHGELAFWYSDGGFQMWDGATIKPIGFERVDTTFAAAYGTSDWPNMSAAVDATRNVVAWAMATKVWLYNWVLDKWSIIDLALEIIFPGVTKTLSVDEQDPSVGANDDNLDYGGLVSFDNARFAGGDPRFYVFNGSHALGVLSGANLAASITGCNVELTDGRDTRIRSVRPMTDAVAGMTITMAVRQRLADTATSKTATTLQASGEMPIRARGRFVVPRWAISASQTWTYVQGLDLRTSVGMHR